MYSKSYSRNCDHIEGDYYQLNSSVSVRNLKDIDSELEVNVSEDLEKDKNWRLSGTCKIMSSFSFQLLTEPKFGRTKRIKVWANGESQSYGIYINPRSLRSWTSILLHITIVIQPSFGAVKKLLALNTMQPVDSFEDLDQNMKYVALGSACKFKEAPAGYLTDSERETFNKKRGRKRYYNGEINSNKLPFLMETKRKKLTIVYMMVNGRPNQFPIKVVFNERDMSDWEIINKYLTKILDIPEGIKSICTIFGQIIQKPVEFQHGYLYVAVPFMEHFITLDYGNCFKGENRIKNSYTSGIRPATRAITTKTWTKPEYCNSTLSFSSKKNSKFSANSDHQFVSHSVAHVI